ncbi:hypothetical protein NQ318_023317 [Aromia moschata]|uniref:Piwi n=1 Tax=Aromia moschata TaxID=1265417 RepID=A0AAV8XRQ9_9CUCU|nr:hypothetical protein NQ318_023317 [Aromia moschata]
MEPRGRGRARGRARGQQQQQQQTPRPGPPQGGPPQAALHQPQQAPGQGAWGRPPLPQPTAAFQQPPASSAWVRPPMEYTGTPPIAGRGARQKAGDAEAGQGDRPRVLQGAGEEAGSRGRGPREGTWRRCGWQWRREGGAAIAMRSFTRSPRPSRRRKRKFWVTGHPIQIIANYFELIQAGKWCLNQYRVDFSPEIDHTGQRRKLMRNAMQNVVTGYLFDGTLLYTPQKLAVDPLEVFVRNDNDENIRITVRLVGDLVWGDFHYLSVFNIIIRKCLAFMKFQMVGRNYYDPHRKIAIPEHKMELWPGYVTSMRQHEEKILLNCDVSFKFMRMDNVYDMLLECRGQSARNEFQAKVIGSIVLTYYNNKMYRIDDVDYNTTPASTFPMKDGTQITFAQYYRQKYNINIQVDSQPMLVSRSNKRELRAGMPELILLVPELCQLTGLTDRQRENFQLMRTLAEHTRIGPQQRIQKLTEFSKRMKGSQEVLEELRRWDLGIADSLIRFSGRVLPQETIIGGDQMKYPSGPQADWTKELRGLPMFIQGQIPKFAVICPVRFKSACQDFMQCLQRSARGMKWDIGQPRIFDIPDDRSHSYLDQMETLISKNSPSMIMCVVPNNSIDRYSAIKKKGCVDRGVPTQVILAKNLSSKGVMSIATKVAIQLNCKVGGSPWTVTMPLSSLMVVGYDVCRDTANKGKSFSGMVASLDKQITRYFNFVTEHKMEEELSDNFASFMLVACQRFKDINGRYPERIIVYRDGVGEGQLPYVYEHEVADIKKRLSAEIYKEGDLKMAFVVVSKRINTRLFTDKGNPPPGTVVDDVITMPQKYDFFIVSQCVKQGTVAPTSYNVIEDTMGLPPDRMQMLTYKLCHMYYNWSGTVRVPAPCQYAHKLAFLVAQALHRPAHRALETTLYYL